MSSMDRRARYRIIVVPLVAACASTIVLLVITGNAWFVPVITAAYAVTVAAAIVRL